MNTADASVESCPTCLSPFDNRRYRVEECVECGTPGSTACCVNAISEKCAECEEAE